jgi:hypothetical protein
MFEHHVLVTALLQDVLKKAPGWKELLRAPWTVCQDDFVPNGFASLLQTLSQRTRSAVRPSHTSRSMDVRRQAAGGFKSPMV